MSKPHRLASSPSKTPISTERFELLDLDARALRVAARTCVVHDGARERSVDLGSTLQPRDVVAGDRVQLATRDGHTYVHSVRSRRSVIARPDPHERGRELVLAANIDLALIVVSVRAPPLHPRLIDRFMVVIQRGGAEAVLCVNKWDLLDSDEARDEALAALAPYADAGLARFTLSTRTGDGIDALRAYIHGRTTALVGHSGVGKSSLLNALDPRADAAIGAVSAAVGRGKHTTSSASMREVDGGTWLIDTPGVRALGLDLDKTSLATYFPEFDAHAVGCRFRDCAHMNEPRCAVRDAAQTGSLSPARYDTYLRILATL